MFMFCATLASRVNEGDSYLNQDESMIHYTQTRLFKVTFIFMHMSNCSLFHCLLCNILLTQGE